MSRLNDRILEDIFKTVKRHASSSTMIAFFNAGDRDFDIAMLEKRLSDRQRSILVSRRLRRSEAIIHSKDIASFGCGYIGSSEHVLSIYYSI